MFKRITTILTVMTLVFLTGCDQNKPNKPSIKKAAINVENASWLRDKLPEKTLAYIRMPTIWNIFFDPSADSLYPALNHANNQAEVDKLQNALFNTFVSQIPEAYKTHLKLLVKSIDTPLEMAVTNAVDNSMVPNFLMGTTLKDFSKADMQILIDSIVTESKDMVSVLKPLSDDGKASLMAQMIPIYLNYDLTTGRMSILAGPTASDKVLMEMLAQKQAHASLNNIMEFEDSVDQSGKNQQAWVNVKAIYQQNQAMIPPPQKAMAEQMGLVDIDYVWMGTAQHSGKGELIFHVQMPDTGVRKLLPRVNEEFDIQTAGTPDFALVMSLPTVEQISQAYEFIKVLNPELKNDEQEIQEWLNKANEFMGVDIADFLNAYGQQVVVVKDESGLWMAQKIVDKEMSQKSFDALNEKFDGENLEKTLSGVAINELSFSLSNLVKDLIPDEPGMDTMKDVFYGKQRIYTAEENGYFVWASVPQILADRANSTNKNSLKAFLQKELQLNWNQALFAWATESEYVSRNAYHTYLEVMSFMGNIAKSEVDLFSFPTAQELNLPKKGRFGISLNSSPDFLSLRVSYENSVIESMSASGGMFGVAVVGILAAYAIPAYQDYEIRAKVGERMMDANSIKSYVEDGFYVNDAIPTAQQITDEFGELDGMEYNEDDGSITVLFSTDDHPSLSNKSLYLIPQKDEYDTLVWNCESNLNQPHLPIQCR